MFYSWRIKLTQKHSVKTPGGSRSSFRIGRFPVQIPLGAPPGFGIQRAPLTVAQCWLWGSQIAEKHKLPKYYGQDCLKKLHLHFRSYMLIQIPKHISVLAQNAKIYNNSYRLQLNSF